ncbi:hypothetical protein NEOLEDRAFT_1141296 [Neolentinus lepideus HHB14362 ss-1]|uniref:Uncharacterized protein n=1 Tax=Neolentinus lepideus HHB14362 ss-1 TaxID=1314782 RepID=A0A165NR43_9AGAM|nr:hypothetical protein NEOLEDRAFT_1141296 [Neolentinus lepideus HHB14362 ss-1]
MFFCAQTLQAVQNEFNTVKTATDFYPTTSSSKVDLITSRMPTLIRRLSHKKQPSVEVSVSSSVEPVQAIISASSISNHSTCVTDAENCVKCTSLSAHRPSVPLPPVTCAPAPSASTGMERITQDKAVGWKMKNPLRKEYDILEQTVLEIQKLEEIVEESKRCHEEWRAKWRELMNQSLDDFSDEEDIMKARNRLRSTSPESDSTDSSTIIDVSFSSTSTAYASPQIGSSDKLIEKSFCP